MRKRRYAEGASTLSQQLARGLWLDNDKTWRRKIPELLITIHLERELPKEKIFDMTPTRTPLGRRAASAFEGSGNWSRDFCKDVSRLSLPEAATLACDLSSRVSPIRLMARTGPHPPQRSSESDAG